MEEVVCNDKKCYEIIFHMLQTREAILKEINQ